MQPIVCTDHGLHFGGDDASPPNPILGPNNSVTYTVANPVHSNNNDQLDCDIFVTPTIITQPQSGYNSENTNAEQILNVNTLYPQIDTNVLKPSAPCETKNPP